MQSPYWANHRRWAFCLLVLLAPSSAWAHRTAEDQFDPCQIQVGYEPIHITAYTPKLTKAEQFCQEIPGLGQTQLVFDYVGKKLRNIPIEFEVTKEPEGKRLYYHPPVVNHQGTMSATIDFKPHGAGDYKIRVTIVHKGKRLDTFLPIKIGVGGGVSMPKIFTVFLILALAGAYYYADQRGMTDGDKPSHD